MSALYASRKGKVLILTKNELKASNTWYAQGGVAAAVSTTDSFNKHIADTIKAGRGLNDRKTVEFIVKNAPKAIKELEKFGIEFAHQPAQQPASRQSTENYNLKLEGGHSEKRVLYYKDKIGQSIESNLIKQIKKNRNITTETNAFALDLIMDHSGQKCIGVEYITKSKTNHLSSKTINENEDTALNQDKEKKLEKHLFNRVYARRIILATGGAGQVFSKTTNPAIATGDGIAMAARAGAKIKGMEFVQFHPTALVNSTSKLKNNLYKGNLNENAPLFLLSETLRGEGAKLLNYRKERFMIKVHPQAELAPRDIISKAIFEQQKKGPVFIDLRAIPLKTLKAKYPAILDKLKKEKISYLRLIKITPAAHYLCGGIKTDIYGRTSIKNLYAMGECANNGLHGANRLASNSLLEAAVMSGQVAKNPLPKSIIEIEAQSSYQNTKSLKKDGAIEKQLNALKTPQILSGTNSYKHISDVMKYRNTIQKVMMEKCGIIRNRKDMESAKKQIQEILSELNSHRKQWSDIPYIYETINLSETALLILNASLRRKKSIGCHIVT